MGDRAGKARPRRLAETVRYLLRIELRTPICLFPILLLWLGSVMVAFVAFHTSCPLHTAHNRSENLEAEAPHSAIPHALLCPGSPGWPDLNRAGRHCWRGCDRKDGHTSSGIIISIACAIFSCRQRGWSSAAGDWLSIRRRSPALRAGSRLVDITTLHTDPPWSSLASRIRRRLATWHGLSTFQSPRCLWPHTR